MHSEPYCLQGKIGCFPPLRSDSHLFNRVARATSFAHLYEIVLLRQLFHMHVTTQVPVRAVYLTSGRTRKLTLGKQVIELQHARSWQLTFAKEPAGEIVRALAWAGSERADEVLKEIETKVPRTNLQKVSQHISLFPGWLAAALSRSATYA